MSHWEYKVVTSGKGGFATPALMEKFLNDLGKEEWEIISFHTPPDNPLAFHGLARRGTQREWTLDDATAAAKAEADKVRAEFAAKFAGATFAKSEVDEPGVIAADPASPDGLRRLRDTENDNDPEALAEEAAEPDKKPGDWDEWPEEEDLPTFFEAVKPHMRRNQRGPGQAVAIDYLSKRWDQREDDIVGALVECGLTVPETDESPIDYSEFDGDLYWLNRNQRGQLFLNVREKPRPVFRIAQAKKLAADDPAAVELAAEAAAAAVKKPENENRRGDRDRDRDRNRERDRDRPAQGAEARPAAPADAAPGAPPEPLPAGEGLLDKIRPHMRRNRRGPGFSGSTGYLAKALKQPEADLVAALAAIGLVAAEQANAKPEPVEIGGNVYWLNKDGRGGIWINGHEKRHGAGPEGSAAEGGEADPAPAASGEAAPAPPADASAAGTMSAEAPAEPSAAPAPAVETSAPAPVASPAPVEMPSGPLVAVRALLTPAKRGSGFSAELGALATALNQPAEALQATLVAAGFAIPADAEDKPVYVDLGEEGLWISRNAKEGTLWLNAKPKPARKGRGISGGTRKKSAG
jgi:Ni/Co efflux regulator RcnB